MIGCFAYVATVPLQTTGTCSDLDQLAMNTNPNYLSNCARDSSCTQVTCQGSGILSGQVDSSTIALSPCEVPPGIVVSLARSGTTLVNELITAQRTITYNAGLATVNVNVFVNSTTNSIGILVSSELTTAVTSYVIKMIVIFLLTANHRLIPSQSQA